MTNIQPAHFKDVLLKKKKKNENQTKSPTPEFLVLGVWEQLKSVGRLEPGRQTVWASTALGRVRAPQLSGSTPFPRAPFLALALNYLEKTVGWTGGLSPQKKAGWSVLEGP